MDAYQGIRSIPFPSLASALGINLTRFKKRSNGEYYGSCPIHQSKGNHTCFSYHPDGRFNCFSCSAKGRGGVDLAMKIRSCGFKQAVEFLEGYKPAPDTKNPPAVISESVEAIPDGVLKPYSGQYQKFKVACPWLEARVPSADIRERYGVFCYDNPKRKSAYSGRVMIPVKDVEGILYGYLGRITCTPSPDTAANHVDIPKYLFPKSLPKSRFLFGAAELKAGMFGPVPLRICYLVESAFAVMKFASLGLPAVSPFGWSVSGEQCSILCSLTRGVVFLPDTNKWTEAQNVCGTLAQAPLWIRCPSLAAGIDDPEQLSREQILGL